MQLILKAKRQSQLSQVSKSTIFYYKIDVRVGENNIPDCVLIRVGTLWRVFINLELSNGE